MDVWNLTEVNKALSKHRVLSEPQFSGLKPQVQGKVFLSRESIFFFSGLGWVLLLLKHMTKISSLTLVSMGSSPQVYPPPPPQIKANLLEGLGKESDGDSC